MDSNMSVTIGAFVFGIGILISIINLFVSLRDGDRRGKNPWNSDGLEWATDSPPKPYGSCIFHLLRPAIRYGTTSTRKKTRTIDRVLDGGTLTPTTTWLDAEPVGIATIPEDSLLPS